MKNRITAFLLVLCLSVTLLSGCTSQPDDQPVVTLPEDSAVSTTDTGVEDTTTTTTTEAVIDQTTTTADDVTETVVTKPSSTKAKTTAKVKKTTAKTTTQKASTVKLEKQTTTKVKKTTTKVKKTTTKAKKTTTKAKKTTTKAKKTTTTKVKASFQTYVAQSNALLKQGKLREALTTLLDGQEVFGTSAETKEALATYFSRVSFSMTTSPDACDTAYCFSQTDNATSETTNVTVGLLLTDSQTGHQQTVMRLTLPCNMNYDGAASGGVEITKNQRCVFTIETDYGCDEAYLYDVYTNELSDLGHYYYWEEYDGVLVGMECVLAADTPFEIAVYNWNGTHQYTKKDLLSYKVADGWMYYFIGDTNSTTTRYTVYRLRLNGTGEAFVGYLDTDANSSVYFAEDKLALTYYNYDEEVEITIPLSALNKTDVSKLPKVGTMLGKTMGQVREIYGEGEPTYYAGASGIYYADVRASFITNEAYDNDVVPDQAIVCHITCAGPQLVLGNLPGAATYDELVAAIGDEVSLDSPEETYDAHDGEDLTFHVLYFTYRGQPAGIRWYDNPYATNWDYLYLSLNKEQEATAATYYTTTTAAPGTALAEKIFQYIRDNGLHGCDASRFEVYHNDESLLTLALYEGTDYQYGIDYYKDTGNLEIYNMSGRLVEQLTFFP